MCSMVRWRARARRRAPAATSREWSTRRSPAPRCAVRCGAGGSDARRRRSRRCVCSPARATRACPTSRRACRRIAPGREPLAPALPCARPASWRRSLGRRRAGEVLLVAGSLAGAAAAARGRELLIARFELVAQLVQPEPHPALHGSGRQAELERDSVWVELDRSTRGRSTSAWGSGKARRSALERIALRAQRSRRRTPTQGAAARAGHFDGAEMTPSCGPLAPVGVDGAIVDDLHRPALERAESGGMRLAERQIERKPSWMASSALPRSPHTAKATRQARCAWRSCSRPKAA